MSARVCCAVGNCSWNTSTNVARAAARRCGPSRSKPAITPAVKFRKAWSSAGVATFVVAEPTRSVLRVGCRNRTPSTRRRIKHRERQRNEPLSIEPATGTRWPLLLPRQPRPLLQRRNAFCDLSLRRQLFLRLRVGYAQVLRMLARSHEFDRLPCGCCGHSDRARLWSLRIRGGSLTSRPCRT